MTETSTDPAGAPKAPATGLAGLREGWKSDLIAGFGVSLIALPLCLGIALASGVPPMAGLIAAIVGGLLASRITGSFVTISGPAAGLIVVIIGAVESMGAGDASAGYRYALAAIVVAGVIQLCFSLLGAGKLADFFPSAAVHGMLAAIGVIIVIKQIFVALGTSAHGREIYEVAAEIPGAFLGANPVVALIAALSLAVLILHPKIPWKPVKAVPAPMWVLLMSVPLGFFFRLSEAHTYTFAGRTYELGPELLVELPDNVLDGIVFPDFAMIGSGIFWTATVSICLVASIESLLSAAAVDTLDRFQRKSNLNRDLGVMGAGSALSGLLGGLPMISEIVRSSANITAGARTQWANFFHGGFLLAYLLIGAALIEHIPLAALAAMLIHVGYKLTSYAHYKQAWEIGRAQLLIFVVTVLTVLATDLIIGVCMGILTKLIIHLLYGLNLNNVFSVRFEVTGEGDDRLVRLSGALVFTNYLSLKKKILTTAVDGHTILDFADVSLIDHTSLAHVQGLVKELNASGRGCVIRNLERLRPVSQHPLAARLAAATGASVADEPAPVLDERQLALREVAESFDLGYVPAKALSMGPWRRFQVFLEGKVDYEANRIAGDVAGATLAFADISLSAGRRGGAATRQLSAIVVTDLGFEAPAFTLEREVASDKLAAWVGYDDIDFSSHEGFSDRYLLRGRDEAAVRAFFTPGVLQFFTDASSTFRVEATGGALLITGREARASAAEVEEMLSFVRSLLPVLANTSDAGGDAP